MKTVLPLFKIESEIPVGYSEYVMSDWTKNNINASGTSIHTELNYNTFVFAAFFMS